MTTNPAKALSLHLGLNSVSAAAYSGWDGPLAACEFDAADMAVIAKSQGMKHTLLRTKQATRAKVLAALRNAARTLKNGDFFFLTFSGHGGQVRDANGDEPDHKDETWCLYDGQLVDDELYVELGRFAGGVRVLVLSDSCHSGTVTRARVTTDPDEALAQVDAAAPEAGLVGEFKPAVILISGCSTSVGPLATVSTTTSSPGRAVSRTVSPLPRGAPTRTDAAPCNWPGTMKLISFGDVAMTDLPNSNGERLLREE
jgi:hypothetical protein